MEGLLFETARMIPRQLEVFTHNFSVSMIQRLGITPQYISFMYMCLHLKGKGKKNKNKTQSLKIFLFPMAHGTFVCNSTKFLVI